MDHAAKQLNTLRESVPRVPWACGARTGPSGTGGKRFTALCCYTEGIKAREGRFHKETFTSWAYVFRTKMLKEWEPLKFKAEVRVTLRREVLDPQGAAVESALPVMGYEQVAHVRVGKLIELWLEAPSSESAQAEAEEIAQRLLANPVLETYQVTVEEAREWPAEPVSGTR
jgi:phosphoribosylformylglycinamidine synthase